MKTAGQEQLSSSLQLLPTLAWDMMYLPKSGSLGYTLFRTHADFTFPWTTHFYHAVKYFLHPFCALTLITWALPPNRGVSTVPALATRPAPAKSNPTEGTKIPNERTHLCTVFHTNYLSECFTRDTQEEEGRGAEDRPAGSAKRRSCKDPAKV